MMYDGDPITDKDAGWVERAPKVSVVMSLYNSAQYLREAIDSVLSQTLTDFEFIIVDDGSEDSGAGIVRSYKDPRIRFFVQKNAGLAAALNRAIGEAKGEFIARMDPDDRCMEERLARQYDYLLCHPEVSVVGTAATCMDEGGTRLAEVVMAPYHARGSLTLPESPCVHPSVMFRRSVFMKAGGYPEEMRFGGEDAVLFNRMLSFGAIANLSVPQIFYRLSPSSMSQKSRKFNCLLRTLVTKKVLGMPVSEGEFKQLGAEYKRRNGGWIGYHMYVGKLLISVAGSENRARTHLFKAIKGSPLSFNAWLILAASYFPPTLRERLRSWRKKIGRR